MMDYNISHNTTLPQPTPYYNNEQPTPYYDKSQPNILLNNSYTQNNIDKWHSKGPDYSIRLSNLEDKIYFGLNIFCILYFIIPLIWIYFYRNSNIVRQRNFILTFMGGFSSFLSAMVILSTQNFNVPCASLYYTRIIFKFIAQSCFVSRACRLILLYSLNNSKVKNLSQKEFLLKMREGKIKKPNSNYKSIFRTYNKSLTCLFMAFLSIIIFLVSYFYKRHIDKNNICNFKGTFNLNDKILLHSQNLIEINAPEDIKAIGYSMNNLFKFPNYMSYMFIVFYAIIVLTFMFADIKDDQKFGIKFDCFSNAIINLITLIIHDFLCTEKAKELITKQIDPIYTINKITKNGLNLIVFVEFYIQLTSIIIPLVKSIRAKQRDKTNFNNRVKSKEYFYKLLNSPAYVEDLKRIAVQEFSVADILFWENYCSIRKMTILAMLKQSENRNDNLYVYGNEYLFPYKNFSFDPYYPILPELFPYYNAFYHTFINPYSPCKVNITERCRQTICDRFNTDLVVGIFDEAKEEVVESMYHKLFPHLLQSDRKHLENILY